MWIIEDSPDIPITPLIIAQGLERLTDIVLALDDGDLEPLEALPLSLQEPLIEIIDQWNQAELDLSTLKFIDALGTYAARTRRLQHVKRRHNTPTHP
jgi:hypothetical protein